MPFKRDDDFLRFITMGAAGSAAVAQFLTDEYGHRVVELERYAMANKIWATKIKRLRLADLVCVDCGLRVEARAKSKLEIRMSHSDTLGREWDAGLRDSDICAFVLWHPETGITSGQPACFTVGAMRETADYAKLGPRKSASEGAERDMTWPASVPKQDSLVEEIDERAGKVKVRSLSGRLQTFYLRNNVPARIYVERGGEVAGGATFVLGCVEEPETLDCPGRVWSYAEDLDSGDDIERYVAVKAAGIEGDPKTETKLRDLAEDEEADVRIRLEAWASLSRIDPARYTPNVLAQARERNAGNQDAMAMAMEAIFILSELGTPEGTEGLAALAADRNLDSEARCAAVWGLGVAGVSDPMQVLPYIADNDEEVALHALAAIGPLPPRAFPVVASMLDGTDLEAASAATLLVEQGDTGIECLLDAALAGRSGATWAVVGLGQLGEAAVRRTAGDRLTADLDQALKPFWAQGRSWLRRQQFDTPLQFLRLQTIRHLTLVPDATRTRG
jgi:hypothetical protein